MVVDTSTAATAAAAAAGPASRADPSARAACHDPSGKAKVMCVCVWYEWVSAVSSLRRLTTREA